MTENQIKQLVSEVIRRLAERMGADGRKGKVIVAVSAATVGFSPAMVQLRQMVLGGYRLELAYSANAGALHRDLFNKRKYSGESHGRRNAFAD